MNRSVRLLSVVVLAGSGAVAVSGPATAAVDTTCSFAKASKLVTLKLPANDAGEGQVVIGRIAGSKRIGFDTSAINWQACGTASTSNTNKIKIVGTQQSEYLVITLENGPLAPGAARERAGIAEIEWVTDLGTGTDTVEIRGGDGNDRLTIDSRTAISLNGDKDSDVRVSGVDAWILNGGPGNDVLNGHGAPRVTLSGKEGGDKLIGSPGRDTLNGDGGDPLGDGNDILIGGAGDDNLYGDGGRDRLVGGADGDRLYGRSGNDVVDGGAGSDYIYCETARDGADTIRGGPGSDTVSYADRNRPLRLSLDGKSNDGVKGESDNLAGDVETLNGGLKADVLVGNGERNSLNGNAGADVLKGMGENDSLNGGDDNDKIFGGPGDESISNGPGSDQMFGESGDDTLYAGSTADGRDVFSGGMGDDRIDYSQRTNPVVINVKAKNNDGEAGENDDVRPDFETLISGSGNDVLTGDATPEYFYSGGGDDTISGGGGSDRAFGGAGLDTLTGNEGYDYLYGESDNDTVFIDDNSRDYSDGGPGFDTLYLDEYDSHTGFEALVS